MTTKNQELQIDTARCDDGDGRESAPPSLTTSTTLSSAVSETESLFTPRDQPVMSPELREQKAYDFVHSVGLDWEALDSEQQLRAKKVQSSEFTWSPNRGNAPPNQRYVTTFAPEWAGFVDSLSEPHKAKLSNFENVFFDEEGMKKYMAIRRQLSGICGSHSSVMIQHYIESYRAAPLQESNHRMLDISSFIRTGLSTEKQKQYIEKGTIEISAFDLMKKFTKTMDFDFVCARPVALSACAEKHRVDVRFIHKMFQEHGPGLVSHFRVGKEFIDGSAAGNPILEGPLDHNEYKNVVAALRLKLNDDQKTENLHAMGLLGSYHDADTDRYWFVLQNTHKNAYFRLVDSVHLASCGASVYFANKGTDMTLKGDYNVTQGEYAETSIHTEECMSGEPET